MNEERLSAWSMRANDSSDTSSALDAADAFASGTSNVDRRFDAGEFHDLAPPVLNRAVRSDGHRRSRLALAQGWPHPNRYPNRCCPAWAGVPVSASPVRACGSGPWCRTPRRWVARVRAT